MYDGFSWSKDYKAISNHAAAVILSRLQAGHIPPLQTYVNLLYLNHKPTRKVGAPQKIKSIFGNPSPPHNLLITDPEMVLAFARAIPG